MSRLGSILAPVAGGILVLVGVVLLVLPGPGIPLIFLGLSLLGSRLPWAQKVLHAARDFFRRHVGRRGEPPQPSA